LLRGPAVLHARLLDRDGTKTGGNSPGRQVAVTHDLAVVLVVQALSVVLDPVSDLRLDGLSQEVLGTLAENLGKSSNSLGQWHDSEVCGSIAPGGVLLGRVGPLVDSDTPRVRRLSSPRYPQHLIIPPIVDYSIGKEQCAPFVSSL
jgi:hypothetical protein